MSAIARVLYNRYYHMSNKSGTMMAMNELIRRLTHDIEQGLSRRQIASKAGVSDATIRKILVGKQVQIEMYERLAENYFRLPKEEVLRMAGILPSMYDEQGEFSRDFLLAKIWEVLNRLPEEAQALALAEVLRIKAKYSDENEETER